MRPTWSIPIGRRRIPAPVALGALVGLVVLTGLVGYVLGYDDKPAAHADTTPAPPVTSAGPAVSAPVRARPTVTADVEDPHTVPGVLDPRFRACTEVVAHGYGPYVKGTDPEYLWYIDEDRDGLACERV